MKGLLIKDWYCIRKTIGTLLFILAFLTGYCFLRGYAIFIAFIPPIVLSTIVLTGFRLDISAKWERLAVTMAVTKREIVVSKYWEALGFSVVGTLAGVIVAIVYNIFAQSVDNLTIILLGYIGFLIGIFASGLMLFMLFRWRENLSERMDIIMIVAYGAVSGIVLALAYVIKKFNFLAHINLAKAIGISLIAILVIYYLLYKNSYKHYKNQCLS